MLLLCSSLLSVDLLLISSWVLFYIMMEMLNKYHITVLRVILIIILIITLILMLMLTHVTINITTSPKTKKIMKSKIKTIS